MAETVNQQISDALLAQQIRDARLEADQRRQVWALLLVLEADLLAALKAADPTQWALLARRRQEVEQLVAEELDPLITSRYAQIAALMDDAMLRLARQETQAVARIVNTATAEETITEAPPDRRLRAGVVLGIFPSPATPTDFATTGAEWWTRQGANFSQRVSDSLMVSVSFEETLTQATQRIHGTPEQGLEDGLMAKARTDAARLVRTQTTNAVSEGRVAVAERHVEQGLVLIHQSILDSRTSHICLSREGLRFEATPPHDPIGHNIPYLTGCPYHPHCRSTMITVVRGGGPIQQDSASTWLRRRDTAFQDAVLGPTRAQMFRQGKLSLRALVDALTGRPLTLEELGA